MPPEPDTYSVWLVPDRETTAYGQLEEIISDYAQAYDDAPEFEPHITLVGGITGDQAGLKDKTRTLAREGGSFEVSFTTVQCSTTRHQCIFLLVKPTLDLLSLRQAASRAFEMAEEMYVPHLSLVYSDMSIEQRLEVVESIDTSTLPEHARIDAVALVDTTGAVPEWERIRTVQFGID